MVKVEDATEADITIGLNSLVVVEDSVKLDMRFGIVSVVFVVIESDKVSGVISATEKVVWEGSEPEMNHHSAVGALEHSLDVVDVAGKLDGVSEDEGPGFAIVCDVRRVRVVSGAANIHYLFSD